MERNIDKILKDGFQEDTVLDALKEFVILYDKDMTILYANRSAAVSLNLKKEELIGKKCSDLWHREKYLCENCPIKRAIETGKFEEGEITTSDGKSWYIKGYPVRNKNLEIIGVVEVTQEITEKEKAEKEIKYLAFHDKLTGLYNRAFLEEELERLNTERQLPISIIMGDLNGLKLMNDTFGHEKGDEFIKAIADILSKSCRGEDIVARWGGDEFVILLPKTPKEVAEKICNRIKNNCIEFNAVNYSFPVPLSIALGHATKEHEKENIEDIFRVAEDGMYRNKLVERKSLRDSVLQSLKDMLWRNSYESKSHEERIEELVGRMADFLYLSDVDRRALILLSSFHDIGEITISSEILKKEGKLASKELDKIKTHAEIGYRIAEASYKLTYIAEFILSHHEWWDGSGYPRGLKGEEIPLISRIFSIVDAYEVMTSGRPYEKAKTKEEAIQELKRCASTQFDPNLVEAFINVI